MEQGPAYDTCDLTPTQIDEAIKSWVLNQGRMGRGALDVRVDRTEDGHAVVSWQEGPTPEARDGVVGAQGRVLYKIEAPNDDETRALGALALECQVVRLPCAGFDVQIVNQHIPNGPPIGTMQLAIVVMVPAGVLRFQERFSRIALPPNVIQQQLATALAEGFACGEARLVFRKSAFEESAPAPRSRVVIPGSGA